MDVDDEVGEVRGPLARLSFEPSPAGDDTGDDGPPEDVEEEEEEEEGEEDEEFEGVSSKGKGKAKAAADEEADSMLVPYPDVPLDTVVEFTDDVSLRRSLPPSSTIANCFFVPLLVRPMPVFRDLQPQP